MIISPDLQAYHRAEAEVAASLYVAGLATQDAATDWHIANARARLEVASALRASAFLTDIPAALEQNGAHMRVFRHLLAPPISQDQFSLLCSAYSKAAENSGRSVTRTKAEAVAAAIYATRDRRLTRWLDRGTTPSRRELTKLFHTVPPILSQQIVATVRRNRMSSEQEGTVVSLLESKGWNRKTTALIDRLSDVPAKHYLHKTRFATRTLPQEVDIACGLGKDVVLAMECKVTNDPTNSVKRINDVLKKAKAWQDHWGSFVRTAALLQGVIGFKDVHRLLESDVEVFWSHNLADFSTWIDGHTKT